MANDSTVKVGSWGARTVEKIIRIIERAYELSIPMGGSWIPPVPELQIRLTCFWPPRCGKDLLEPGAGIRIDSPSLRIVRPECCRWRLHSGVLRHRGHGRRKRLHVPRI